jgi:hypothetical protein
MMGEELYAAYLASGPAILAKAFPTNQRFEDFRKNFNDQVFERWGKMPRVFSRAMFMFDVSLAAHPHGFLYWADFFQLGQTYLRKLRQPIGVDPKMDAFERSGTRPRWRFGQPSPTDLVDTLARPLIASRIIPALPSHNGAGRSVDRVTRGFVEEGYILEASTSPTVATRPLHIKGGNV